MACDFISSALLHVVQIGTSSIISVPEGIRYPLISISDLDITFVGPLTSVSMTLTSPSRTSRSVNASCTATEWMPIRVTASMIDVNDCVHSMFGGHNSSPLRCGYSVGDEKFRLPRKGFWWLESEFQWASNGTSDTSFAPTTIAPTTGSATAEMTWSSIFV